MLYSILQIFEIQGCFSFTLSLFVLFPEFLLHVRKSAFQNWPDDFGPIQFLPVSGSRCSCFDRTEFCEDFDVSVVVQGINRLSLFYAFYQGVDVVVLSTEQIVEFGSGGDVRDVWVPDHGSRRDDFVCRSLEPVLQLQYLRSRVHPSRIRHHVEVRHK